MPAERLQVIVHNTVAVMTTMQERHAEWHKTITGALQDAQQRGADWQSEADFYTAVVALLDGQSPSLPDEHPYALPWHKSGSALRRVGCKYNDQTRRAMNLS